MKYPILLPNIFDYPFTYESESKLNIGDYVNVPFGSKTITGVVWDKFEEKNNKNFKIKSIKEKPEEFINGGFFVLSNKVFKYLKNDRTIFEKDCLPKLTSSNQLLAFKHKGFWACMDTIREKKELNEIWNSKQKAWKVWNE